MERLFTKLTMLTVSLLFFVGCGAPQEIAELASMQTYFESDSIIPGNMTMGDDGTIYLSVNPLYNPSTKIYAIDSQGAAVPYPNIEYAMGDSSIIKGVIGVRMDSDGNLWMLDMVDNEFIVWNSMADTLVNVIDIPENVVVSNSFLQDFVIDEKNDRVIIADMTIASEDMPASPAFVVLDLNSGAARRVAENNIALMPEVPTGSALNPIAIDPTFNWVYFGALNGRKVYRVPAASFANGGDVVADIEYFGVKPYSDGIAVDANQNVYITNIEDQAIGITTADGYTNIAMLPEGQTWPDGLFVDKKGNVYVTVSQLGKSAAMNGGIDATTAPYSIFMIEADAQ